MNSKGGDPVWDCLIDLRLSPTYANLEQWVHLDAPSHGPAMSTFVRSRSSVTWWLQLFWDKTPKNLKCSTNARTLTLRRACLWMDAPELFQHCSAEEKNKYGPHADERTSTKRYRV